jgi:hypothetical protein
MHIIYILNPIRPKNKLQLGLLTREALESLVETLGEFETVPPVATVESVSRGALIELGVYMTVVRNGALVCIEMMIDVKGAPGGGV